MGAIRDAAILLLDQHERLLTAMLVCMVAGLVMGSWRPLRTHAGTAIVGAASLAVIYRERVLGVYAVSLAAFLYVGLVDRVVRSRQGLRWRLAMLGILALVAAFFVQPWPWGSRDAASAIGGEKILDMLVLLRLVVFVWEYGGGRIEVPTPVGYLAWCGLPFPLSGTLLRPSEFLGQRPWEGNPLPRIGRGWWVDVAGRAGMLVAGLGLALVATELDRRGRAGKIAVLYGAGPWGLYLLLAAAAGVSRLGGALGGIDVPANFNAPFKSRSIGEFWSRWNITVTAAFRDMLFYNRWGLPHINMYFNTMVVFLFVGIWHGMDAYWVLWGLVSGAGFGVFIFWRSRRGPRARPLPAPLGWALTYVFVCSAWAVPPKLLALSHQLATYFSSQNLSP